jgi:hypothetical protein
MIYNGFAIRGKGEQDGIVVRCRKDADMCVQCERAGRRGIPYDKSESLCPVLNLIMMSLSQHLVHGNKYADVRPDRDMMKEPAEIVPGILDLPLFAEYAKSYRSKPVQLTPGAITLLLHDLYEQVFARHCA